ncbi:hypothetical protein CEXT_182521 [Caerostris extrusa]|uniref:Uncharacterized protein n=1 Tax=Caerostris extrusa TaxID=172846 RepID=A0AAV4MWZ0_CAEEX|nr:hypothetical protein CEXT_182521 [Caerostris extrusa]
MFVKVIHFRIPLSSDLTTKGMYQNPLIFRQPSPWKRLALMDAFPVAFAFVKRRQILSYHDASTERINLLDVFNILFEPNRKHSDLRIYPTYIKMDASIQQTQFEIPANCPPPGDSGQILKVKAHGSMVTFPMSHKAA